MQFLLLSFYFQALRQQIVQYIINTSQHHKTFAQNMNLYPITTILIMLLALKTTNCITQIANFPEIQRIKSGDYKTITSRLSEGNSTIKSQDFFRTFTNVPFVAIGLVIFEVEASTSLTFTVNITSTTRSGFTATITTGTGTFINHLLYTYLALDSSQQFGLIPLQTWTTSPLPVTNGQIIQNVPVGRTLDTTHTFVVKTFLNDFSLTRANNDLSIRVDARVLSSTQFEVTLKTNSTVNAVSFYLFWVDKTVLEQTNTFFIDSGYSAGEGTGASDVKFSVPNNIFNYYNFMRGMNWLAFKAGTGDTLFSLRIDSFPFQSVVAYKYGMANLLHWRNRQCPTASYYFLQEQLKCYDTCPSGYANNVASKFCQKCHYTCLQCLSDGTTCTSCPAANTTFRINPPFNASCPCQSGYFDVGNSNNTCALCDYKCTTCVTSSTTCTSCHSTRDYNNVTNTCLCKQRSFDTGTNSPICSACQYSCLTCTNSMSTCTSCNAAANRILVLTSCLCQSGFSELTANNQQCTANPSLVCSNNCLTCAGSATTCTGCDSAKKRVLANSACQCKAGYTSPNAVDTCTEICGDGLRFQSACDDGNTNNGDGCSSLCTIQTDFTCNLTVQPNVCIYRFNYTITLLQLTKRETENVLDVQFQISPAPPANSIPSFNVPSLTILSYTISGGSLNISVQYQQSIPEGTFTSLSVSNVGTSQAFQLKSSNNLSLTRYSSQNYTAYLAQLVLIYIFLALSLLGSILTLIFYHNGLLAILEYLLTVGLVWIGVSGMTSHYMLFYVPLRQLKYIYAYNMTVTGEDGLFAYINYGLILLIVPLLMTGLAFLICKIKPSVQLSQNTKKYLLVELTYMVVCYYSVAVMYGLITEQFTKTMNTPLSIASIVFGVLYFLLLAAMTVLMVKKSQAFSSLAQTMFKPKGLFYFSFILLQKHISIVAYLLLCIILPSGSTKYPPFIVAGLGLANIVIIAIVRPYKNNIRIIINQIVIIGSFLCYYVGLELSSAQWGGFVIVALLWLYMIFTFVSVGVEGWRDRAASKKYGEEEEQADDDQEGSQQGQQEELEQMQNSAYGNHKLDLDFDPSKQIEADRMATVKKPQILINPYTSNLHSTGQKESTYRRAMLDNIQ